MPHGSFISIEFLQEALEICGRETILYLQKSLQDISIFVLLKLVPDITITGLVPEEEPLQRERNNLLTQWLHLFIKYLRKVGLDVTHGILPETYDTFVARWSGQITKN